MLCNLAPQSSIPTGSFGNFASPGNQGFAQAHFTGFNEGLNPTTGVFGSSFNLYEGNGFPVINSESQGLGNTTGVYQNNLGNPNQGSPWYFDSGATSHITNNLQHISQPQPIQMQGGVQVGNGSQLQVTHTGSDFSDISIPVSVPSFNSTICPSISPSSSITSSIAPINSSVTVSLPTAENLNSSSSQIPAAPINSSSTATPSPVPSSVIPFSVQTSTIPSSSISTSSHNTHKMVTRSKNGITKPKTQFGLTVVTPTSSSVEVEPVYFSEAVKHDAWKQAMSEDSLDSTPDS
ncbi:hypothetical protein Vadar_009533 [Vaccinium darrowii]|uniref:Uncharacterized protein n=1 Tax=Vaccinium darrowii TaxID=229202 RepID=A0ACB7YKC4_9ERIC|nr:hypothetical protein Vadar_009533 [Vaccinium darrowii]